LPTKNGQQSAVNSNDAQMNILTSVHQHVAASTPLRKTTTPLTFSSSLPSPITPAMSLSTVKMRGRGLPVAESEKMLVLHYCPFNSEVWYFVAGGNHFCGS